MSEMFTAEEVEQFEKNAVERALKKQLASFHQKVEEIANQDINDIKICPDCDIKYREDESILCEKHAHSRLLLEELLATLTAVTDSSVGKDGSDGSNLPESTETVCVCGHNILRHKSIGKMGTSDYKIVGCDGHIIKTICDCSKWRSKA